MRLKIPKNTSKYYWTKHAIEKMRFYGLSEQKVRAVIRNPRRKEEGIVKNTIAVMQPPSMKTIAGKPVWKQEIWVMYQTHRAGNQKSKIPISNKMKNRKSKNYGLQAIDFITLTGGQKQIRIISAWRYPGVSPKKDPIPQDILDELDITV